MDDSSIISFPFIYLIVKKSFSRELVLKFSFPCFNTNIEIHYSTSSTLSENFKSSILTKCLHLVFNFIAIIISI